jgi:ADP-ribose pyrophosphatase
MPDIVGTDRHLIETKRSSQEIFNGNFLRAFEDSVELPDGSISFREYIVHPGASMIIPLLEDEVGNVQVIMERQFRYPIGAVMVEFPAGKLDLRETSLDCAKRELREETGYTARQWARAGAVHPAIAYSTESIDVWFARQLTPGLPHLDRGEFVDVIAVRPQELQQWCIDGRVSDAKTLAGALWLQNVLSGSWVLDWQLELD